jgi:hypothetical protein
VNEIISGFGAVRFAVVCSNGGARLDQLISQYIADSPDRQRGRELDYSQRELLRSLFQLNPIHEIRISQSEIRNS